MRWAEMRPRFLAMTMKKRKYPRCRAFSLLESVVVMVVIILLASIVIPGFLELGKEKEELPLPKLPEKEKRIEEDGTNEPAGNPAVEN